MDMQKLKFYLLPNEETYIQTELSDEQIKQVENKNIFSFIRPDNNYTYYHWMFESLYDWFLFDKKNQIDYFYIPITKWHHLQLYIEESLLAIGIRQDQLLPVYLLSKVAAYPNVTPNHVFNSSPQKATWPLEQTALTVKEVLCKNLKLQENAIGKKIYVSREDSNNMRITNNEEVKQFFISNGFESVVLSQKTLSEQAQLFRDANVIVAAHGTGLANLMFSKPNTRVIEILNQAYQHKTYEILSYFYKLKYHSFTLPIYVPITLAGNSVDIHIPVTIDTHTLQSILEIAYA